LVLKNKFKKKKKKEKKEKKRKKERKKENLTLCDSYPNFLLQLPLYYSHQALNQANYLFLRHQLPFSHWVHIAFMY
jgi:hypothetical protein